MNKKIYNEDLTLNLILNGDKLQPGNKKLLQELYQLDDATRKLQLRNAQLELEKRKLNKTSANYANELKRIEREIRANNRSIDAMHSQMMNLRQQIGITGLTINQLNSHLRILQTMLRNATNPATMAQLQTQIAAVQMRIQQLTTGASRLSIAWSNMARTINKYSAAVGWLSIIIFSVSNAIGNLISRVSVLDRTLSAVMKTTGLTRAEMYRLKHEFDIAPTPTNTDDLLKMAEIAGKLGIDGYENIKKFTTSIDVLNTALKSDLNMSVEEVANHVGKLVNAFRVTDKMPINEALLRTGSLLNELDKSSVASAGTILNYMTRLSSLGTTANYPMEKLAGIAAAMETVNISAERGSTALMNIIGGLGKHAEKFSRILGMGLEEYKKAVETDINDIFLRLIEITSKGDKSIIDMTESMGTFELSGVRVRETYQALAKNLDVIRTQQDIATEAFKSSASVMAEFNIISNDFQGNIDTQKKRVRALADEFNLKFAPSGYKLFKLWVDFLYVLRNLSKELYEHQNIIKSIALLYVSWKATVIATWIKSIWSAVTTYTVALWNNVKATVANNTALLALRRHGFAGLLVMVRQLWAAFLANPLAPVIGLLAGAAAVFTYLSGKIDLVKEAISDLQAETINQTRALNSVFDAAINSAKGTDKHKAAIKAINEQYGIYLPKLLTEADNINTVTKARNSAIGALQKEISLKWENERVSKLQEEFLDRRKGAQERLLSNLEGEDLGVASRGLDEMTMQIMDNNKIYPELTAGNMGKKFLGQFGRNDQASRDAMREYIAVLLEEKRSMSKLKSFVTGYNSGSSKGSGNGNGNSGTGNDNVPMTEDDYKAQKLNIERANKAQIVALNNSKKNENAFKADSLKQQLAYTNEMISLEEKYAAQDTTTLDDLKVKRSEIEREMYTYSLDIKKNTKDDLIKLEEDYGIKQSKIKRQFLSGEIKTEDEYNDELLIAELEFLGKKQKLYKEDSKEYIDIANEILSKKIAVEKSIQEKILTVQKQLARIRNDRNINEIEKSRQLEEDRWAEELDSLNKQLIVKKVLKDDEVQYNDLVYKLIEAKLVEHNERMRKINMVGGQGEIDKLENALKALDKIGNSTTFSSNAGLTQFYDEKKKIIEAQYQQELTMADGNQKLINDAEKKHEKASLDLKFEVFEAEKRMNEAKIQMAQNYIDALRNVFGAQSEIGKALYLLGRGLAIADIWIKNAAANAIIYSTAMAEFAWAGPGAPALATAWAAAPIAANNTFSALNTGLILAQTIGEVAQWASGKYPVKGKDDGKTYMAEWGGMATTGIYGTPALIAERGPEMVVDYPTLRNMQMNAPGMIKAIMAMRVPQYGAGKYDYATSNSSGVINSRPGEIYSKPTQDAVIKLNSSIDELNKYLKHGITAKVAGYGGEGSVADALTKIANLAKSVGLK